MADFVYRIHPAIGIARVGNSEEFVLAPETMAGVLIGKDSKLIGGLPIRSGTESDPITSSDLRDPYGGLKRHAARFRIYQYPELGVEKYPNGLGKEVRIGGEVDGKQVKDIQWTVHLANKKANCFVLVEDGDQQGIAGYDPNARPPKMSLPPIRNWPTAAPNTNAPQPEDKLGVLNDPHRVKQLTIDPGPRTISGASASVVRFDRSTEAAYYDTAQQAVVALANYPKSFPQDSFPDMDCPGGPINTLGELRTDDAGRLLVTGGYGRASGWKTNGAPVRLDDDVNNDQWFDDTSDGPVSATLVFDDGSVADVHGAWVTVTDPSYAPQILNVVSLWDDIYDAWVTQMDLAPEVYRDGAYMLDYQPTFEDQVRPVFQAAALQQWTTNLGPHGEAAHKSVGSITAEDDPNTTPLAGISAIFRDPNKDEYDNTSKMPLHLGDAGQNMLALRKTQHFFLQQWSKGLGGFRKGSGRALGPGEQLDKATFVNCLGGRFSPGIDLTFIVREPDLYAKDWERSGGGPFRIATKPLEYGKTAHGGSADPLLTAGYVPRIVDKEGLEPGDISKFMALPWHTDYNSCATHPLDPNPNGVKTLFWSWPAQRPVSVYASEDVEWVDTQKSAAKLGEQRWSLRGTGTESPEAQNWGRYQERLDILANWHNIGTVLQSTAIVRSDGVIPEDTWFLEAASELADPNHFPVPPFPNIDGTVLDARELFFRMLSDTSADPDTLSQARQYTESTLAAAQKLSNDPSSPLDQQFFSYTPEAFQERIDLIYQGLVNETDGFDPANNPVFSTRQDMVIRTIQFSPFNLTDGAWLRNIGKPGPIDEVRSLLYSILMDELGDGDVSKNHCNIYQDLLHSLGYYPAPINTREFAYNPELLDSAFTVPAFELCISQFSDDYYPEILGMTLNLEWEVVDLKGTRDLLDYFGMNSHYYVMHIGIDNAVNGHGQRAAEAIKLYLQNVRSLGGESAVQQEWRRIWNGFVAFGTTGTLGDDIAHLIQNKPSLEDRVLQMIQNKAKYGSLNHEDKTVGDTRINEWFLDPPSFLKALGDHGYITPGDWANSRLNGLMNFQSGPMFRVFTDDEIQLWADYTNNLGKIPPPPHPPIPPARAMAALIDQLRSVQKGVPEHQSKMIGDVHGVLHSISWWFDQPTTDFMRALVLPANGLIKPGDPEVSRFVTVLIAPNGPMGWVFDMDAAPPNTGNCREVVVRWVMEGCPIPASVPTTLRLNALGTTHDRHPRGRILGMGAIH